MNRYLIFCFLIILSLSGFSITINCNSEKISIEGHDLDYLLDTKRKLDIKSIPFDNFKNYKKSAPNFGFYDGVVWLKFKINCPVSKVLVLELENPNLDIVQIYEKNNNEKKFKYLTSSGDYFPFSHRKTEHRFFQFPLHFTQNITKEIIIRIDNHGDQLYIPISLSNQENLAKRDYFEQYISGIYFGILLFVLLLNLFIYLVIKEEANLYYLLYLAGLIFLQLGLSGYGFQFIWKNSPYFANHSLPILASFSVFALLKFTRLFLNTKEIIPKIDKILHIVSLIILTNIGISFVDLFFAYKTSIVIINILTLLLNIAIIPITIFAIMQKFKPGRFFLLAFIVLIISVFAFILRNFGILSSNIFTNYSLQIGSSFEVILLSFAIVDKFKTFKDESLSRLEEMNFLKSRQNEILEKQVMERTFEINLQKEKLASKNREITDSITYAKRIQNAILPPVDLIKKHLPDNFVLYLPKDIVAGDFYWLENVNNKIIFAVADCTGHGVPGAMVSVVCYNALNRAVWEYGLTEPAKILDKVTDLVIETFSKSNEEVKDGMDIALCSIEPATGKLEFAGANNPLYLVNKNELIEIKPDRQPIGKHANRVPFKNNTIELNKGDLIYIFSDGFADQFGGISGKKFMYKQLKQLFMDLSQKSLPEQSNIIESRFNDWKGELEQIDDVCIIAVKV